MRQAVGLDTPFATIGAALDHLGYVQIDPINICGRMHDLILRNRVAGYREGDLMRYLHGVDAPLAAERRVAFEHHVPGTGILVAFPLDAWPHLLAAMRGRTKVTSAWSGRLTPREKELVPRLLDEIAARGPLSSDDFDDPRQARRVWGAAKLVKATLQKLFFHGRLLIAWRANNRRQYDLPERVLPARILSQAEPSAADIARWSATLKLRQRRLTLLKRDELSAIAHAVQAVAVEGCPTLFCLREDVPALLAAQASQTAGGNGGDEIAPSPRLLAPLDPLIYDRRVTAALWEFDYTWEAYTPPKKRVRGHYALPVLVGTELVGHVNPRADREQRKLQLGPRAIRRGHTVAPAVRELAQWLGMRHQ